MTIDETTVTDRVARYLSSQGWRIHAVHYPGAQAGVRLRPLSRPASRSKDALVPDIVASKRGIFLLVESKPRFELRDAHKAQEATRPEYVASLVKALELAVPPEAVLPAVAFSGPLPRSVAFPPGLVLFIVARRPRVRVLGTLEQTAGAASVLPDYQPLADLRGDSP